MLPRTRWARWLPSIALRMTAWYALSAFVLIFGATGFLYRVLANNLEQEDIRILTDTLNNARASLHSAPSEDMSYRPAQALAWASGQQPQVQLRILDQNAIVLTETPGMSAEVPLPTAAELNIAASTREISSQLSSQHGRLFQALGAIAPATTSGKPVRFVQVAMYRESEEQLLHRYREQAWIVLTLSVIASSLAGYVIARSGMRPIENIGQTAERIRSTTLHERITTAGLPAELSGLAETFNAMLDRLEDSFARVSQFSDDVAHELRTPVNNLRGEIEVALSKVRSTEDYREILGSCLEECARISRVIQSLLFLARAQSATITVQRDQVNVVKELIAVQEFYEAAAAEAGVELHVSVGPELHAPLDRTLFQQAVGNLVSNAITHTPKDGSIHIAAWQDTGSLHVSVTDTGCGIPPEHLPRVLDRFYRVDRARSGSIHNVGLGLSVVKAIVERHGGRIEIESEIDRGTRVTLCFPREAPAISGTNDKLHGENSLR